MGPCVSKHYRQVYVALTVKEGKNRREVRQLLIQLFGRCRKNTVLPAIVQGVGPANTASMCNLTLGLEILIDETMVDILRESSPVPANILSKYTTGSNSDASSCNPPVPTASSQTFARCMSVMAKAELARRLSKPIMGIEEPKLDRPVRAYRPPGM
uniref:Uncharacterized protein n=1 Tax=Magallana gigas TaxID=29159 RepID=K1QA23_MAGGI